jgi:hypothetical protein
MERKTNYASEVYFTRRLDELHIGLSSQCFDSADMSSKSQGYTKICKTLENFMVKAVGLKIGLYQLIERPSRMEDQARHLPIRDENQPSSQLTSKDSTLNVVNLLLRQFKKLIWTKIENIRIGLSRLQADMALSKKNNAFLKWSKRKWRSQKTKSEEAEALTPNHFVLGSSNGLKPPGVFRNDGPYLKECWKEVQRCANIFWQRFIHEYTPTLTRRTKWFDSVKPLEVGDLVINFDETLPRNTYKRARVVDTIIGTKGQVRRARIQQGDGSVYWRPAVKLGILEVDGSAPTRESLDNLGETIETGGSNVGAETTSAVKSILSTRGSNLSGSLTDERKK